MKRRMALAAAIATGVQVGAAMVATRVVAGEVGPVTLALLRYVIGFLCLAGPGWMALRRTPIAWRDVAPVCALGIGQFGVLVALLNAGLRTVPSGRAALLFATFPLLTMLIAAALGQERLSLRRSLGVALTVLGVGLAVGTGDGGSWLGQAAVLGAALAGAACSVGYRPYLKRYPPVAVSAVAMLASVAALAVVAPLEGAMPALGPAGWGAVLFIGVGSGAGYFLWLHALKHLPATEVTMAMALSPLTALGLGAALLGEPIGPGALGGFAAVSCGLWLATRHRAGA